MSLFDIQSSKRTQSIENFDFIYLTDTLSLPLIDDFSTNKFKVYKTDTSGPNISDSSWNYLFFFDGSLVPLTNSYMSSPTFTYAYDSINSNGTDTLIMLTIQNDPDTLIINNLLYYPITNDTIILWPNVTIIDSLWTAASPDTTFANLSSDYHQDSISLYFVSPKTEDLDKIWLDNNVFLNYNYPKNPWTLGVVTFNSPLKRNAEGSIFSTVNEGVVLNELLEIDNFSKSENITILNLWASWCIPCQNEVGELKKINLNDNYQVIGILVDDSIENGKEFIAKNNIDYINVLNEFSSEQLLIKFMWNGIPTTLILNENLEIIYTINGEITAKEIFNLTD